MTPHKVLEAYMGEAGSPAEATTRRKKNSYKNDKKNYSIWKPLHVSGSGEAISTSVRVLSSWTNLILYDMCIKNVSKFSALTPHIYCKQLLFTFQTWSYIKPSSKVLATYVPNYANRMRGPRGLILNSLCSHVGP